MQIAFFPWLRLRAPLTLDDFTFFPFLNHDGTVHQTCADVSEGLTSILQGYVDMQGRPIENCVIVTSAQRQPVWDLHDEDHERISKYAKILMIAAFSKNEYNTNIGCYSNTSHFQFVRQRFTLPVDFITYGTRRRDGSTMNGGYRHAQIRFPVPPQAQSVSDICIDTDFASSITSALGANSEVAHRLLAGMLYFDIANTDSDAIRPEAEIILMASAYERLLDIEAKARAMNEAIGRLLSTYAHVTVQEALQSRPGIMIELDYDAAQRAWPLHRKWAQEFYHLRNQYTHANDGRVRTWGWHPIEHLVMAAFLFPLAAKLLLQAEGHYTLTEDDEGRLHAIDRLLELQGWGQPAGAYPTNWHRMVRDVISELARARAVRQAVEELKRQGIVPPEPDGEES